MIHKLFTLASALSLVLCLATAMLWVRSYSPDCGFSLRAGGATLDVSGDRGQTRFSPGRPTVNYWLFPYPTAGPAALPAELCDHHAGGFGLTWRSSGAFPARGVVVPDWFLLAAFAVLPAGWMARATRRHRREVGGRCRVCGYDLRASPERCPECGTPVGRKTDGKT